jgi:hypothetical protein
MTSTLNNPKYFPSRISINKDSVKHLESIVRRLYRYFSHTFFHHYEIFYEFEKEMHLCERFTKYITEYNMMPSKYLIIPNEIFSKINTN